MLPAAKRNIYWLIGLLAIVLVSAVMAFEVRSDFGNVDVTFVRIPAPDGHIVTGRLYRPVWASAGNKLPAVLAMHGGNNDKDTQSPVAIELARRGFVVLASDADGHGDNTGDFEMYDMSGGAPISATLRGADVAYEYLRTLPFVDATRIGATGHSMGGGMSTSLGVAYPEIKAVAPQDSCGRADLTTISNYLCVLAAMETREVDGVRIRSDERFFTPSFYEGYGFTEPIEPNRLYGSFADDSAFMIAVNPSTHPGTPPSNRMVWTVTDWMRNALKGGVADVHWVPANQQIYKWYDIFMGVALLAALATTIPLTSLLLGTRFFGPVAQPMPSGYVAKPKAWWRMALLNAFIAGITYPILTQNGQFGKISQSFQSAFPFLDLVHPNGLIVWMIGNVIIFAILFYFWYRKARKEQNVTMYDLGMSFNEKKLAFDWGIIGRTVLLALVLVGWLYLLVGISQAALGIEFRVEYPVLKVFTTWHRFGQFLVYLIPVLFFMLLNNGLFLFGQARQPEAGTATKTQVTWWLKNWVATLTFLALILILQNVPIMIFNSFYGYDLIGFTSWSASIGGSAEWMMTIILWLLIPFFTALLFLMTWFFRRTGRIYLGSIFAALIVAWLFAVGNRILG